MTDARPTPAPIADADPGAGREPAASGPACEVTLLAHHIGSVGGMERQITDLIMGLRRLGHEVTVIAYACELPPGAGVKWVRVPGPGRPLLLSHPWFMLAASLALRRAVTGGSCRRRGRSCSVAST